MGDQKSWLSDNPQVEDGRIGGNVEFDQEVRDQYTDEVNHMMRRLRLNMYRAEDAMFPLRKRQWEKEDAEFAKEQERRKRKEEDEKDEELKFMKPKPLINPGDKMLIKS